MIVVRIELWPGGSKERRRDLALVAIANTGAGNAEHGDYVWAVSHQFGSKFSGEMAIEKAVSESPSLLLGGTEEDGTSWKHGRLDGFARRKGAVRLVFEVLKKAFGR